MVLVRHRKSGGPDESPQKQGQGSSAGFGVSGDSDGHGSPGSGSGSGDAGSPGHYDPLMDMSKCAVQRASAHVRVCKFSVERNFFAIVVRVSHRSVTSSRSSMCGRAFWARAVCSRTLDVGFSFF